MLGAGPQIGPTGAEPGGGMFLRKLAFCIICNGPPGEKEAQAHIEFCRRWVWYLRGGWPCFICGLVWRHRRNGGAGAEVGTGAAPPWIIRLLGSYYDMKTSLQAHHLPARGRAAAASSGRTPLGLACSLEYNRGRTSHIQIVVWVAAEQELGRAGATRVTWDFAG